jgi:hypothetical protein
MQTTQILKIPSKTINHYARNHSFRKYRKKLLPRKTGVAGAKGAQYGYFEK